MSWTIVRVKCGKRVAEYGERDAILAAIEHEKTCTICQRILKLKKLKNK